MPLPRRVVDHNEIREWAAFHKAIPASSDRQAAGSSSLLFMFLDGSPNQPEIKPIAWEDFFAKFDLLGLALACEDTGNVSKTYELLESGRGPAQ